MGNRFLVWYVPPPETGFSPKRPGIDDDPGGQSDAPPEPRARTLVVRAPVQPRGGEHVSVIQELSQSRKTVSPRRKGDGRWALFFLAPWFVGLALITAGPMGASLYL